MEKNVEKLSRKWGWENESFVRPHKGILIETFGSYLKAISSSSALGKKVMDGCFINKNAYYGEKSVQWMKSLVFSQCLENANQS